MFPISNCNLKEQSQDPSIDENLTNLFKLFSEDISEQDEMKPSTYQKEVSLSLQERLKQLKSISKYHNYFNASHGGDFLDCFDVDPCILVFQNWDVNKQYATTITIRNKTKKVKFVSISVEETEIFLITPKQVRKMSSLSSLVYKVKFLPVHFTNYKIKMTINSDDSFYNFEMIALPPRPIIEFPDRIDFDKILINFNSMKWVYVTNIGCGDGMAKIFSDCPDIHIEPEYICLKANEVLNLEIKFHPSVLGHVKEKIIILYSTGEKLFVEIEAFVSNGNIFLNEKELVIKDTLITFNEFGTLVIYNKSDYSVHFQWHLSTKDMASPSQSSSSTIFGSVIKTDKLLTVLDFASNDAYDLDTSESLVPEVFTIMPMEGVLATHGSLTFIVMFNPITVGKVESMFQLEVEGLENRLSVKISGNALGPSIHLNISTLDVDNIYVNEKYNYLIFAQNTSLIKGTIRSLPLSVCYNKVVVTVDFEEAVLNASDTLLINIGILTGVVGSFVVELRFEIVESKNILRCILKGTAIEPVIKINESSIDFGTVPIGVNCDKYFTITNHSLISVRFQLEMASDGFNDAILCDDFIRGSVTALPENPKEFHLEPNDVTIAANSSAEIKISLVASMAKVYSGNIIISSELHLNENKKLPVSFIAIAPEISCLPESFTLPFCFKGIEYEHEVLLSNKGNVQVAFWFLEYRDETNGVYCHGKEKEAGLIGPSQSIEYTLRLSVGNLGEHTFTVMLYVLGNGIIPLCDITLIGTGPAILVDTLSLSWPHIDLFNPFQKMFSMTNTSPLLVEYSISLEKDSSVWIISTYEGTIQPDETLEVTVTPKPTDPGLLKNCLLIEVKESRTLKIKLEALAIGTSIFFTPSIFPSIDFGSALRIADNKRKILVSNIGSRAQFVILSIDDSLTMRKVKTDGNSTGKHFQIQPSVFRLAEYSEINIWVSLKSHSLGHKEETIHCFTRFESRYKLTYLDSSTMCANFRDLNFTFDPPLLHFIITSDKYHDPEPMTKSFTMHIDWESSVKVIMTVPEPFGIYKDNSILHEETFMVSIDKPLKTDIQFDPMFVKDYKIRSYSRALSFFLVEYHYKRTRKISGDVFFPNISLSHSSINFECVELFNSSQKEITMKNPTPTEISYRWYWVGVASLPLHKNNLQKPLTEISYTPLYQENDLCGQTMSSLKILKKSIENRRFSTFKEFENKAKLSGLNIQPLEKEIDSHDPDYENKASVGEEYDFLEIIPFFGEIGEKDCITIFINFTPQYSLFFEAIAVCVIKGGLSEKLVIKGCCSPIDYEIIPEVIDFGFAPCCEICKSIFIIKNNCLKKLPFKVYLPKLSDVDKTALKDRSIWVEEESGVVKPFSSIEQKIAVWFGTIGEIDMDFLLEVNNKNKNIKIRAYCCPNQIMISLPRKFPHHVEEYLVLASLREPWFFVPEFITKIEDGWELIIIPEMLPNTRDIYLGMERFFLHLFLRHHPLLFSEHFLAKKHTFSIKDFRVPCYFIDFGIVILGTKAEYKVKILNYYPREVVLKIIFKDLSHPKELEFQDLHSVMTLPPLGTKEFSVSIFATNMFEKSDIHINHSFDIEVICGPMIPVLLTAVITLPRLLLPDSVDFGTIKCNEMKIINIPIKNIGIIPCEWIVYVRDTKGHHHKDGDKIPFTVKKPYGYTETNTSEYIPIYFKPTKSGDYNMILKFVINMNPEKISIPIKGIGLKPLIVMSNVDFGHVVPFSKPIIKTLEVINLSPFPVRVFFSGYNDEIMAETLVYKAITRYYKSDIYVLNTDEEIIPFYKICNIFRRIYDEAFILAKVSRRYNITEHHQSPFFGVRKSRSEMVISKRYKLELRRYKSLPDLEKSEARSSSIISICKKNSPELILEEYFDYLNCGFKPIPVHLALKNGNVYRCKPLPPKPKNFTLIIVLGAPETDHIEWGAKLAKNFGMISVSLDDIIFQELVESDSEIAEVTRAVIRELYIKLVVQNDCFDDPSKYSSTDYLELKSMVEELISKFPLMLFQLHTASIMIDGVEYSQQSPFGLSDEDLKLLIRSRILRYSSNILIENIEGIFFTDVTFALSTLIELFADNTNFHIINLHSFPIWYLKLLRTLVESDAKNNFKAIMAYVTSLHGIKHAEILKDIPSFVSRYYYLFNTETIDEESGSFLSKEGELENREKSEYRFTKKEETVLKNELKESLENSSPFIKMIGTLCNDIIKSKNPEIVWTRSFICPTKLHSFLRKFLIYARWFSSLVPLWSSMRASSSIFSGIFKLPEDLIDFSVSIEHRATKVVNNYSQLPLWILCTEDLDFEKFIPLICSQKKAFDIKYPEPPSEPKEKTEDLIPKSSVYFHLSCPKTIDQNPRLSNFKIYKEIDEANILEIYNKKAMKEELSEMFHDQSKESSLLDKMNTMSEWSSLTFSKKGLGELQESVDSKLLESGEKATWKIVYSPITCGRLCKALTVRATGLDDYFTTHVEGICDIPTVTFEFSNLLPYIPLSCDVSSHHKSGFCIENSTYYFRPALISRMKTMKSNIYHEEATFIVKNISDIKAKVFINFHEESEEFDVQPKNVEIEPNETVIIIIVSSISSVGNFMNECFLSVENNPLPHSIKVHSQGIFPNVKFEPKNLSFKNALLYQEKIEIFRITNLCYKPIHWEISSMDSLDPVIRFSKMSNILEPHASEQIAVSFRPEIRFDFKQLFIEVIDAETKQLLKFKKYTLKLYASDIRVQINTDFNMRNYLEFGIIKACKQYVSEVKISTCGDIEVFYRARIANHKKIQGNNISDCITINSIREGYINKKCVKLMEVNVCCKNEIRFDKIKAIFIEIYSPYNSDLLIAKIPLIFSFQSHFPKYTLYPGDCLDFGSMEIDTEKQLFLILENIGAVDFNYFIKDSNLKRSSSSSLPVKSSSRICIPPLKSCKVKGNILPGNKEVFEFIFKPNTVGKISRELLLTIPELPKKYRTISVCCTGIAPLLNFDPESLFRELHIVDTRQELCYFRNNGSFVAVFVKTEKTLYFINVSLHQRVNIDLFIENKSHLDCNVSMLINGEGFCAQPSTLIIKSYLKEIVTLTYSPLHLGIQKGEIEIKLNLPYLVENSSFTFFVEGSSELPAISIYDYPSETIIKNNPIRIGFSPNTMPVRRLLRIENSGNLFSQTIIDIQNAKNVTAMLDLESIQNMIGTDSGYDTKSVRLYLRPKEKAVMGCTLTPLVTGKYSATLVAYTVLNPYEKREVIINGEAITTDILLDGLPLTHYFHEHSKNSSFNFLPNYDINFGLCEIGTIKKVIFYINNQTEYTWAYKFCDFDFVSFLPSNGLINPHSRVMVRSTLNTKKPFPTSERRALVLAKVTVKLRHSGPFLLWAIGSKEKVHYSDEKLPTVYGNVVLPSIYRSRPKFRSSHRRLRHRSDQSHLKIRSNQSRLKKRSNQDSLKFHSDPSSLEMGSDHNSEMKQNEMVYDTKMNTIIVPKLNEKIILASKFWPVNTSLSLYHENIFGLNESRFRSIVINQCSEEILLLENSAKASCRVKFQLENITFKELGSDCELLDKIGFVKMPSDATINDDFPDELHFVNMNQVFPPEVCLNNVFWPLSVQEMLLPDSTIKSKFTFYPPKPGAYTADVRIILDDMLLGFPRTQLSVVGYIPPVQVVLKNEVDYNEFTLLHILPSVKCIKMTAYEPKSFIRNKLIYVYNATDSTFSYNWYNKDNMSTVENSTTGFYCHQASGNLEKQSMLKLEMIFNPQDYGIYESLWYLKIPDYNTEQAFLFIGETKIPDIVFEPDILVLDPVFFDMKTEKKIKIHNKEKVSFKYKVDAISLYSDIESEKLYIDPPSGILERDRDHEVKISSTLRVPRKHVYKTFWSFENVAKRWCFKVITQCLNVEIDVMCLINQNDTKETVILKENENNFINIGKVSVDDVLDLIFILSNKGKVAIAYEWIFSDKARDKLDIEINRYDEIVPAHTEFNAFMKITVLKKFNFKNIPFILKVFKGPTYTFFFHGSSEDPFYRLSFKEHNFGTCLIQTNNDVYNSVNLRFENLEGELLRIKLKCPVVDYFKIELPCSNVTPNCGIDIPIYFFPREKRKYDETIELSINNTFSDFIVLLGEGEFFQVDVVKPLKRIIAFDKIGIYQLIKEETRIINISNIIYNIKLKIKNKYGKMIEIKLDPTEIELKPNLLSKIFVYVKCSSLGEYSGIEVLATCQEYETILYFLTINCVGAELMFDRETINFFPHFRKQFQREEVAIINSGNIPARFKLDTTGLPKFFKIEPLQGECLPGIPYILNILCCLKFITSHLSVQVKCSEEGKNEYLVLTLITYPFPPGVKLKTLKFLCPVRQQNTRSISVKNRTKKTWSLLPLITGQYFSGKATLKVPPESTEKYTILYKPLVMTKETHKGILVIPTQPEEIIVQLEGRSTEPMVEGKLSVIAIAREKCVITLTVENPLEILQKMSLRFEGNELNRNLFNIEGRKCIVLPSRGKGEYIINFYAYMKGIVNFDVIFTNDETHEYMYYNVTVVIEPPAETWETVEMHTMVYFPINKTISIYNPLEMKDTFTVTSPASAIINKWLKVEPSVLDVDPKQHGKFSIIYSPHGVESREVQLNVTSDLIGTYFYRIILSSEPHTMNIIPISNPLGSKFNFILRLPKPIIKNVPLPSKNSIVKRKSFIAEHKVVALNNVVRIYAVIHTQFRKRTSVKEVLIFMAKSDNADITINPVENLSLVEELFCTYEPTLVGTSTDLVTVQYFKPCQIFVYKLVCQCEAPQPQGPFDIYVSEPFVLTFKNVFNYSQNYSCLCVYDECCLKISKPLFTLEAKEVIEIQISVSDDKFENSSMVRISNLENLYHWDYYFDVHR
nr:hydrocephalus-inducing protein homolog [Halyomorpha halys]